MSTEGVQSFMCVVWVVQTEPKGRPCQQWGAQMCVLCCADESIGRFVSTEGFTCMVYRLKHRERERDCVKRRGSNVVCVVQVKAERKRLCQQRVFRRLCQQRVFRRTPAWFVLCRFKQRERLCEQSVFRCTPVWFVLCRLKRSSSQDFEGGRDHVDTGEFRRGGVRATATARLAGWSQRTKLYVSLYPHDWGGGRDMLESLCPSVCLNCLQMMGPG